MNGDVKVVLRYEPSSSLFDGLIIRAANLKDTDIIGLSGWSPTCYSYNCSTHSVSNHYAHHNVWVENLKAKLHDHASSQHV